MHQLNFPTASLKFKSENNKQFVFDVIRKKYVVLTPEEWVRQHLIHYLIHFLGYPPGLIGVETPVKVTGMNQRADVVVFNRKGIPVLIAECKAPGINISNSVFQQAARYNRELSVDYLLITNGLKHYCARLNKEEGSYQMLKAIPDFDLISG